MIFFSLGWDFRIILHPVKGLSGNVEAPRNALRLSIEYVFILIEKIQSTKELVNDKPFDQVDGLQRSFDSEISQILVKKNILILRIVDF